MKKIIIILILAMVSFSASEAANFSHRKFNKHATISTQRFYDELAPYGDWIYSPDYGYIWRPYFDYPEAFRPYSSGGHWVYTEYGWTWMSDYPWGWATFHYGRWDFDDYLGWVWIPGYEWAPAWVSWGSYGDYYGWAPLGPRINVSINFGWHAPDIWWTFVPGRHFCSANWHHYIYDRPVRVTNITYITNIYNGNGNGYKDNYGHSKGNNWFYGPRVSDVERFGNAKVRQMQVADADRPSEMRTRGNTVNVYRPGVNESRNDARPVEYRNIENARTGSRIQSQTARTNDPGEARTRETRIQPRNTSVNPVNRNTYEQGTTRNETRTMTQTPREQQAPANVNRTPRENTERYNTPREAVESRTPRQSTSPVNRQAAEPRREAPVNLSRESTREAPVNVSRESRYETPSTVNRETRRESSAPAVRTMPEQQERPRVQASRPESPRQETTRTQQRNELEKTKKESKSERNALPVRPNR